MALLAKKHQDIQDGKIPAPTVEFQKSGGDFRLDGRMTVKQYNQTSKDFNKFGFEPLKRPKTVQKKVSSKCDVQLLQKGKSNLT